MNLKKISFYISIASAIYVLMLFVTFISHLKYVGFNSMVSGLSQIALFTLLSIFFYKFSKKIK